MAPISQNHLNYHLRKLLFLSATHIKF